MQVEEFLETKSRKERLAQNVEEQADEDLFFVDTQPAKDIEEKPASKKEKKRQKLTKAQAILQGSKSSIPVLPDVIGGKKPSVRKYTRKEKMIGKEESKKGRANGTQELAVKPQETTEYDIWSVPDKQLKIRTKSVKAVIKWKKSLPKVDAVQIDAPGCSYNPDSEAHQEVVAEAVAAEMRKQYDRELQPIAPPRVVDLQDYQEDELERLLVESEEEEEEEESIEEEETAFEAARTSQPKRKTIKDRNRQSRHKQVEEEVERKRMEKRQRRDLENLNQINSEVEQVLSDRELRAMRRHADLEELKKEQPPRIGKHKYDPLPIQVLTTEEINESGGSLRKIKPTPVLAKERYKSLQRRGIIEPRVKATKKIARRRVVIHGQGRDNAMERQEDVKKMQAANKKAKKK